MPLPKFIQPYIPSYNVTKLDKQDPSVANEVITQILNLGDEKAVAWIFDTYTIDQIRNAVENPERGVWNEKSLNYWSQILKITDIKNYNEAIQNIYPI